MFLLEQILPEICEEKNITLKRHSYDWVYELQKNGKSRYIVHNQLGLNTVSSCKIADDKYATYEVLNSKEIPVVEYNMIFNPISRSKYYAEDFIKKAKEILIRDGKVIIKANNSYAGKDVYLVHNEDELYKIINELFNNNVDTISACPFINIEYEYRVIYFYDQILLVYKKKRPIVVGNGIDSLNKLILDKENSENIKLDLIDDLDFDYIPKNNEEVTVSWKHNLSRGATAVKVDKNIDNLGKIIQLATSAARAIGIDFASIDIIKDYNDEYKVMEINASVCLSKFALQYENGINLTKDIYSKAIDKLFVK